MSSQDQPPPDRPTTDELAGVYVLIEAEERVFRTPPVGPTPTPSTPEAGPPTTDELAGVYVRMEGEERVFLPPPGGLTEAPR